MHINNKLNWFGPAEITIIRRAVILALVCRCRDAQSSILQKANSISSNDIRMIYDQPSQYTTLPKLVERTSNGFYSHQHRAISMDKNRFNKFICFPQWHKIGIKLKWIRSSLIQYFSFLMS